MEKSEHLSVSEVSEILGISPATVKNWIKLGKLSAVKIGASFWVSKSEVERISLALDSSDLLRQRRNKSRLSSNFIPKSYISNSSPNYKTIKALICDKEISNYPIDCLLFYYAGILMELAGINRELSDSLTQELNVTSTDTSCDLVSEYPLLLVDSEDTLGMLYLSLRGLQAKKSTGAYYTPFFVVDELINEAFSNKANTDYSSKTYIDPACGTGNFLLRLPDNIPLANIHGADIDKTAVILCRINIAIKYHITSWSELEILTNNIVCKDFLFSPATENYDITLGNPPWGYAFSKDSTALIRHTFSSFSGTGKPESFSLFIEKSLKESDEVTFLLPETILGSDYHLGIRKFIANNADIVSVSYLGEVFDKVQCPSVIMRISKTSNSNNVRSSFYKKECKTCRNLSLIRSFSVPKTRINAGNFNILADNDEYRVLHKMTSVPHFYLEGNADFALGIVTGGNSDVVFEDSVNGAEPIIKGKDITKYKISSGHAYTIFAPENYQQVAPESCYRAPNKLFYRFIAKEPIIALDDKGLLSLNSANIIIPHLQGYDNAYIMAVLNSSAVSFYYRHICKNMKVLRSVLEKLPIPVCEPEVMKEIAELATKLSNMSENCSDSDKYIIKRLDNYVNKLYNLNAADEKIITER